MVRSVPGWLIIFLAYKSENRVWAPKKEHPKGSSEALSIQLGPEPGLNLSSPATWVVVALVFLSVKWVGPAQKVNEIICAN